MAVHRDDSERFRRLSILGRIGWWEADFSSRQYLCSEYVCKLLGLEGEYLSFEDFGKMIREDYRARISREFLAIQNMEVYEQTFPVYSTEGVVWVYSRVGYKERLPDGTLKAFGVLQRVEMPKEEAAKQALQRVNDLLYRQTSISHSLFRFLKDEDISAGIYDILKDILDFFRGGRVYIFQYDEKCRYQSCTYEVVAPGVAPEKEMLQGVQADSLPWWTSQIMAQKPVLLETLGQLPEHAYAEYEILARQNIKSLMVTPLVANDQVWGYMGIDLVDRTRMWTNEDYQWFSSLANVISICIELRKTKDEAVRERTFLSNLFRYMPLGYVRMSIVCDEKDNPYGYYVTDANSIFADFLGKPASTFIGKTASSFSREAAPRLEYLLDIVNTGTHKEMDMCFELTNKHCHVVIYSPEKNEVVALFLDTTDSVQTHLALDHSEKLFKNIFANIPAGVEIYDKDGFLVDINNKDMEIFGVRDKQDVIGVNLFENPNVSAQLAERIQTEDMVDFRLNYAFDRTEGYYSTSKQPKDVIHLYTKVSKVYDSKGNFTGYAMINIDNTERIDAMSRICDFENFFLLISDYAKVGYAKLNLLDRKGYAIKQWYKNMGEDENTQLADVVGIYSKMYPSDRRRMLDFFSKARVGEAKHFQGEMRIERPGEKGKWNWVRTNVVVNLFEPENGQIELIGVNYDITELKETEAMLIEAKEKAEESDRLKSAFLANMSHEIRTPLNAIVGFSNLLAETDDIAERREYMQVVEENNDLLLKLISDILDLSKIEAGTLEFVHTDFELNKLMREKENVMRLKTDQNVELVFEQRYETCHVRTDRNRLSQLMINLLTNAAKFTHRGSIRFGYELRAGQLYFWVADTGCGIPAERKDAVFERFVKLNSFKQGTGLGLSICRTIVEHLGGNIGVESEEGKGSTFWFTLPYVPGQSEQAEAPAQILQAIPTVEKDKLVILIAEDNESNNPLFESILRHEYKLVHAWNGREAVDLFNRYTPHLVLMDINMPVMDGYDATAVIRKESADVPIIGVTALAFASDEQKVLSSGFDGYMPKPINARQLKTQVLDMLRKRMTLI